MYFHIMCYNKNNNSLERRCKKMIYSKPEILAQSTVMMANCNPNSKPSGRPCNPPGPGR